MSTLIDDKKFAIGASTSFYSQTNLLDERISFFASTHSEDDDSSDEAILNKYDILVPSKFENQSTSSNTTNNNNNKMPPNASSKNISMKKHFNPLGTSANGSSGNEKDELSQPSQVLCSRDKICLDWKKGSFTYPRGLVNHGNTCFMNSVLQSLTFCPPLSNYLLSIQHSHPSECKKNFCTVCLMIEHVTDSFSGSKNPANPIKFASRLQSFARHFRRYDQQDAHEFLAALRDLLIKDLIFMHKQELRLGQTHSFDPISSTTTAMGQIFGGHYRNQIQCLSCEHSSFSYDYFLDTMLDVVKLNSIQEALAKFIKPEVLQGENAYRCEKCRKLTSAKKQYLIHRAPLVATFQLKRFNNRGMKLKHRIEYPEELNLRPYMTDKKGPPVVYKLFSVLSHVGHASSYGHYYCHSRARNNAWHHLNDERVTHSSLDTVLNQKEAYVLFYRQIVRTEPPNKPQNGSPSMVNAGMKRPSSVDSSSSQSPQPPVSARHFDSKFEFNMNQKKPLLDRPKPSAEVPKQSSFKPHVFAVPQKKEISVSLPPPPQTHSISNIKEPNTGSPKIQSPAHSSSSSPSPSPSPTPPSKLVASKVFSNGDEVFARPTLKLAKTKVDSWHVVPQIISPNPKKTNGESNGKPRLNGWNISEDDDPQPTNGNGNGNDSKHDKIKKKKKKNKKRKRRHSSDSSDEVNWVEKTAETLQNDSIKTIPVVKEQFQANGLISKIKSWNGSESKLMEKPMNFSNVRDYDEDETYNEDFDRGKSKKLKTSNMLGSKGDCFRYNKMSYNPFQRAQNNLFKVQQKG